MTELSLTKIEIMGREACVRRYLASPGKRRMPASWEDREAGLFGGATFVGSFPLGIAGCEEGTFSVAGTHLDTGMDLCLGLDSYHCSLFFAIIIRFTNASGRERTHKYIVERFLK